MTSAPTTQLEQGKDIINYENVRIAWLGQISTDN